MPRKKRKGEYTCNCDAYKFPHRFGGGKCTGISVANDEWSMSYGFSGSCVTCNCLADSEGRHSCEVVEGAESVDNCEAWQEFVHNNEIKIYD